MVWVLLATKLLAFILFCLLTSFVICFGKGKTYIKMDYFITSLILIIVMVVL